MCHVLIALFFTGYHYEITAKKGFLFKIFYTRNSSLRHINQFITFILIIEIYLFLVLQIPTWTAYNSLISNGNPTTTSCSLPIIFGKPTEWNNLFTSLKEVQKINDALSPGTKTIVTFDLQLYSKALQLQLNSQIGNFVIRLGELHVVFTVFKMLGKLINGSGLDKAFEEALIYGSTTVEQIKDGHHLYRCFEVHQILYLSLFKEYVVSLIDSHPLIEKDLREGIINGITAIENYKQESKERLIENHQKLIELISSIDFITLQTEFDEQLTNQAKFLRNYMSLFETLLLFLRASRQQNWELHLVSLHNLCKYFFAFDMINYARLTPVYIAKMLSLKDEDPESWNIFNSGNFSVNKTLIPFSAVGVDHAIEQENRAVKVLGGIKRIANNQKALNEYFLTISEMGNIIEDFCEVFNIHSEAPKRTQHYQFTGSKNQRINDNVKKMSEVFASHEVNFENSDVLYNVLTKKVLPDNLAKEFLEIEKEGQCLYEQFIEERIVGSKCIWDSITKRKLPTFVNNKKIVTVKIRNQLINIRAERKLMSRFIVAARSRPDIDLPGYLGKHEFSAVPR